MDIALIVATPFIMAMIIAITPLNKLITKDGRAWLSALTMAALFIALLGYFPYVQVVDHEGQAFARLIEWVPELGLSLSWYIDGLSLMFGLIVTGIGAAIFLYAGYYFDDEAEQSRFMMWLAAFAGAMLGLVLSGNLLTIFIMWELTSVTSFMLIGFKGAKSAEARAGARQAFLITGAGGLALLLGIVLIGAAAGQQLGRAPLFELSTIVNMDLSSHPYYAAIMVFIMIAAFTKSAQFPFHFWLPGAMEAPTPASAYLHSATMVKAGIYLLARLYPTLHEGAIWTNGLVFFGLTTMLLGAFFALTRRDLKALLAYSTVSKLGAIVAMIGLPEFEGLKAAFIGILAHALYKAALFLVVGTIDHNTGTRVIDKLGGMRRYMPGMMVIAAISALSMAGLIPLFGFVAKELLIDAFVETHIVGAMVALAVVVLASVFTVTAALIVVWDVFFKPPTEEIHYHQSSIFLTAAPALLALGTATFGFLITALIEPLIAATVPLEVHLHLLAPDFLELTAFWLSTGAIITGVLLFLVRRWWMPIFNWRFIPSGNQWFNTIVRGLDWLGSQATKMQTGYVRYYLVVILGVVAVVILGSGQLRELARGNQVELTTAALDGTSFLRACLLFLTIAAAFLATIVRRHITAALALGVMGYSVAGIFLLEHAPDVALVQLLVETLTTVLIILMLGRLSERQRRQVMVRLWQGRSNIGNINVGIFRDVLIAAMVGISVFVFALTALVNRPEPAEITQGDFCLLEGVFVSPRDPDTVRSSIARYHLCMTEEELGVEDVVGAIVADFRGMDTVIEITVFSVAALGVLTLLSRGLENAGRPFVPEREIVPDQGEYQQDVLSEIRTPENLNTPFTRMVSRIVLPLGFLLAMAHIINGSSAPGDGFTAGAIAGLVTAVWFVIFGYDEARKRLGAFSPTMLLRTGLVLVGVNALLPMLIDPSHYSFVSHFDYGKWLGIDQYISILGLHLNSGLLFEIGVAMTVFGGFSVVMEYTAHPQEAPIIHEEDDHQTTTPKETNTSRGGI
ncbi:DUF4040 domain-containing protein [Phototrophicus methaneseepsis]|uniref:DUF4040 domain-containing protein n=1 Tax=Phototrophicus methaneseepsis TaxID=2710758 RepID=A0A7S8EDR7_9CHLR|nr:hydrogen gas-evolving membrane-bound hydrogenase subunit E [Phototrophicus methaneseepsis]QPC85061.1 DUF4040 domain-containing protein [Phototrophicus methaneseepsis]